ncbi:type II toxin-antitoxin system HicB family antitoxin [uncultured Mucilaginibacter sp.]|uniref:type II toxin-antitoxin system HicB family antitoxin n=1 Tax=uncultured Mucilaginibacter sp. TaxID=797541 RepID=UPI0026040DBD|nr:type II toxin-antitoxin system HicB family antitoxin [uncultured Mucilaginibacter sp.]
MKKPHSLPVTFILDYDKESGYYASQIKEYPHVISQGKTKEEAVENAIDAFMEFVEMYKQKPIGRVRSSKTRIVLPSNLLIHA